MRIIDAAITGKFLVYVGLGSSLGDREANILAAFDRLHAALGELRRSRVIESSAVSESGELRPDLPRYLNAAASGHYEGSPLELLNQFEAIEFDMGRTPGEKGRYLPRSIDLDILHMELHGEAVAVQHPRLTVPHPRMLERTFVLEPLRELGLTPISVAPLARTG